jgi:hypothetical protein
MADFVVIRPEDDGDASRASEWCDDLIGTASFQSHACVHDVDGNTPADSANVQAALGVSAQLVLYFGHGDESSWLTSNSPTVDISNVSLGQDKAVVSVACKTSCLLAPAAIRGGVIAWLGFAAKIPIIDKHKGSDPIGDALVSSLSLLGSGGTMQDAHDAIVAEFARLVADFETGSLSGLHISPVGYYASMVMRDQCIVSGTATHIPLA